MNLLTDYMVKAVVVAVVADVVVAVAPMMMIAADQETRVVAAVAVAVAGTKPILLQYFIFVYLHRIKNTNHYN
jgi:hypothetical protein